MKKTLSGSRTVRVAVVSEVVLAANALSGDQDAAATGTNAATIEPTSYFRYVDNLARPESIRNLEVLTYSHEYAAHPRRRPMRLD
jgi:hypothetical protein